MKILLKADDFSLKDNDLRFLALVHSMDVKVNAGVVGDWVDRASQQQVECALMYQRVIEWFSHSYFHFYHPNTRLREYFGMSEAYQRFSIEQTNKTIRNRLMFECETIGFPTNACDRTTIEILKGTQQIKRVFFLDSCYNYRELKEVKPIVLINGYGVLETPNFISFDGFRERFQSRMGEEQITFQLHPNMWSDEHFKEFEKCLVYLKSLGVDFIFASEYAV